MGQHRRPTLSIASAATLAVLAIALFPAAVAKPAYPFVPDPSRAVPGSPTTLEGKSWTEETPDYVIRVQHIDDDERLAYIRHVTGLNTDPFATPPGDNKHFTTFAVQIENRSGSELSFNPDATWLTSERKKDLLTPYGIDDLAFDYRVAGSRLPPAYQHAEKALLQYPTFVKSGTTLSGLLIFREVPNKSNRMQFELALTLATGDKVEFRAPYRRLTKREVSARDETDTEKDTP